MEFYNSLRLYGWKAVLARHTKQRFYKRKNDLLECGISLSHLQNLNKNPNGTIIPFVRLLELKMCDQLPSDYQIPVSPYSPNKPGLHLVA